VGDKMNKAFTLLFCIFFLLTSTTTYAYLPTNTKATKKNLLEDAVINLLQPQMYEAVEKHYGTTYDKAFQSLSVKTIKKLDHPGSWLFEVTPF
jgi:hypothetical protein